MNGWKQCTADNCDYRSDDYQWNIHSNVNRCFAEDGYQMSRFQLINTLLLALRATDEPLSYTGLSA